MESFTGRFPCEGDYRIFPFDKIACNLYIDGHQPPAMIHLHWLSGKPLYIPVWMKTGSFSMGKMLYYKSLPSSDEDGVSLDEYINSYYNLANSTTYTVAIGLERKFSYYILTLYLPNYIILLVAWFSMWFPFDSTRVNICKFATR